MAFFFCLTSVSESESDSGLACVGESLPEAGASPREAGVSPPEAGARAGRVVSFLRCLTCGEVSSRVPGARSQALSQAGVLRRLRRHRRPRESDVTGRESESDPGLACVDESPPEAGASPREADASPPEAGARAGHVVFFLRWAGDPLARDEGGITSCMGSACVDAEFE